MLYQVGWDKQTIEITADHYAMHGYGNWRQRARGISSPLMARAIYVSAEGGRILYCCLDTGYVTYAMRSQLIGRLNAYFADFDPATLVLTCTHTHSGPGGCAHEALYNIVTPGFVSTHLEAIVSAAFKALVQAADKAVATSIELGRDSFDDDTKVAWNRSLAAYNLNPDVVKRREHEAHLALDRHMSVINFRREGKLHSLISFFGVHATCIGNKQRKYDADNKGYAAAYADKRLQMAGVEDAATIFAQGAAGDVSPHFQGAGDIGRRRKLKGNAEYQYAQTNGALQSHLAFDIAQNSPSIKISGAIDAILTYVDFSDIHANPEFANGETAAYTSAPCHGVPFFVGTRVDGPGMSPILGFAASKIARALKKYRLNHLEKYSEDERDYYQRIYSAQGVKDILLETGAKRALGQELAKLSLPGFVDPMVGELKRQAKIGALKTSPLIPTVLPLQIVSIGKLALVCCPGEFTTTAGMRLRKMLHAKLAARGIRYVIINTYCNDYMGYVTTNEEYQQQAYEGGHTVFGQWAHAAFMSEFAKLADEFNKPLAERAHDQTTQPAAIDQTELQMRSDLPAPKICC